MRTQHPGYWTITGTLTGFGLISFDIYFIAYPCLRVGMGMIIYGVFRLGIGGFWAALLGFGTLFALILVSTSSRHLHHVNQGDSRSHLIPPNWLVVISLPVTFFLQ